MRDKCREPDSDVEHCLCTDSDYGWCELRSSDKVPDPPIFLTSDYNHALIEGKCVSIGPEPIPAGACFGNRRNQTYQGSSGYRLLAGNTCEREGGVKKDEPVTKNCTEGANRLSSSISSH